jgi:hypothetical protein
LPRNIPTAYASLRVSKLKTELYITFTGTTFLNAVRMFKWRKDASEAVNLFLHIVQIRNCGNSQTLSENVNLLDIW